VQAPDFIKAYLRDSGLVADLSAARLTPLAGGVSSDIWKVETPDLTFVVKRALPQLRVAQAWSAPTSRNASEVAWLIEAAHVVPDSVPCVLASDATAGIFAMRYYDPALYPVWKDELRAARVDPVFAGTVGDMIGKIHAATAGSETVAAGFANDATFHAIRIEPYLEATARAHPDLADKLLALAAETLAAKRALVHGDVSPKNILVGPQGPILLDAECAWYGEPAFDIAFCLTHLLLKCVWVPAATKAFMTSFHALAVAYLERVDWEPAGDVAARVARLLPALLLARIDGKSPVDYIVDEADKARVRAVSRAMILASAAGLDEIAWRWSTDTV